LSKKENSGIKLAGDGRDEGFACAQRKWAQARWLIRHDPLTIKANLGKIEYVPSQFSLELAPESC